MASTWGENIKLSIFGGSHTEAIGVVLDNLPRAIPVAEAAAALALMDLLR